MDNSMYGSSNTPYSVGSAPMPQSQSLNYDELQRRNKEEEKTHRAPRNIPFELNPVIDQLSEVIVQLMQIKKTFNQTLQHPDITPTQTRYLENAVHEIDQIGNRIFSLTEVVEKLSF